MGFKNSKKNNLNRDDPLTGNKFRIYDFLSKDNIHISKEYRIKSPPLGIGTIGEIREAF